MDTLEMELAATLTGHQNPIFALERGYFTNTFFSGGNDKGVVEWDLQTKSFKRILCAVSASIYALHLIPNTSFLAIALREGKVMIVDVENQKLIASIQVSKKAIFALQSIPTKNELVVVGEDGIASVWCLTDYKKIYEFAISSNTIRTIALSHDQKKIAFGDKNGDIFLFSAEDFHFLLANQKHTMPITSLIFSRSGLELLSGARDAALKISDVATLKEQHGFVPHMFTVYGIYPHPSYPVFATVSRDKSFKIWDEETYALRKTVSRDKFYDSHTLSINTGLWTTSGKYFLTAGDDKLIKVWEMKLS
ncbi:MULTISPECIES: WD40 repeat domain-containing protein [unclassified Sphingobacterium]|uniref:WD40 repeat domain-containing protein n=1 Tax=unclassified Sphingobacterium TaxID=2609468 RepID=UPI001044C3A4|nr:MULTISPECIES: WD40 repeat domain-containing protein [unclassified Sphingobacterium]MCS3555433.1 WD40 repeat protein [Sphingobacterium sp. JUb21]TCR02415.1 WD-40 repeat-containing protein [Sphingobacterium sp. JUb20]